MAKQSQGEYNKLHIVQTIRGSLIYLEEKLVPPVEACKKLLARLHESHSHEQMSWETAKKIWFWKSMKNEINQANLSCGCCIEFSRSKFAQKPILPLELCDYRPGELLSADLFKVNKRDYITITCKLSGQIPGEKLANKSAEETCRIMENLFLRNGPPLKVITDNGSNFTSRTFKSLMEKYMVEHARCSPHHHSGNGSAEKSVDTLKRMMLKVPKATIAEASWKLNNMVRPGMKTTPLDCFFVRRMR